MPRSIPNLKFLASPIPDLRKGFKIKNFPLGTDHALFVDILLRVRWDGTCHDLSVYRI